MSSILSSSRRSRWERRVALILVAVGSLAILVPLAYLVSGSLTSKETIKTVPQSLVPSETYRTPIDGQITFVYNMTVNGQPRQLAVVEKNGENWVYANPDNPAERYTLPAADPSARATKLAFHPENYSTALTKSPFGSYMLNTLVILAFVTLGTVLSSVLVAFAFARYRFRGMPLLFMILLSTVMLPSQVLLIPTFVFFANIGWYNTWLPLIVPAFFANAWDVFLFRQFFLAIPLELDEAAKIDGCGPLRVLWHVILPESLPVVLTVTLFTMIYVWNDYFGPLIYLKDRALFTVALGLQDFNALYFQQSHLQAAGALMMLLPPVLVFFFAQKYFIQGTVVSGVKG